MNRIGPYRKRRSRRPSRHGHRKQPAPPQAPSYTLVTSVTNVSSTVLRWQFDHAIDTVTDFTGFFGGDGAYEARLIDQTGVDFLDLVYETDINLGEMWQFILTGVAVTFVDSPGLANVDESGGQSGLIT